MSDVDIEDVQELYSPVSHRAALVYFYPVVRISFRAR